MLLLLNLEKHPYGVEMINSFYKNWPDEINLTAFIENSSGIDDTVVKPKFLLKIFISKFLDIINL